jgi:leader peptidase (prepilin peptidase) / N-methyltransferase
MELMPALLFATIEIREPLVPLWAAELALWAFVYAWLFCVGATVGSFLNVVIYRLPRGKNLAYPGSYCPQCGRPIRLADNIPICSWLWLRGRCRDCRGQISPRYFIVELIVAVLFVVVLLGELYLPPAVLGFGGRQALQTHDGISFWCMYGLHVALLTTLIAAAFIHGDGFRVPARLFWPVTLAGLALPIRWPEIRSAAAWPNTPWSGWQRGLLDGGLGLAVGLALAAVLSWLWLRLRGHWPQSAPLALGSAVGVVLGWQRTLVCLPIILLVFAVAVNLLRRSTAAAGPPEAGEPAAAELSVGPDQPQPEMPPAELSTLPPHEDFDSP